LYYRFLEFNAFRPSHAFLWRAVCNSDGLPVGAMTGLLRLSIKDKKNLFNESEQGACFDSCLVSREA
jgi:hypothetical protein